MEKNYRPWSQVSGSDFGDSSRFCSNDAPKDSRMSYDRNKLAVGFDFNACEPERDYIIAVTRWMVLKVGDTQKFKEIGTAPCFYYDGGHGDGDRWPVLITDEWKKRVSDHHNWCLVSKIGFKSLKRKHMGSQLYKEYAKKGDLETFYKTHLGHYKLFIVGGAKEVDRLIQKELNRLDRLWKRLN